MIYVVAVEAAAADDDDSESESGDDKWYTIHYLYNNYLAVQFLRLLMSVDIVVDVCWIGNLHYLGWFQVSSMLTAKWISPSMLSSLSSLFVRTTLYPLFIFRDKQRYNVSLPLGL